MNNQHEKEIVREADAFPRGQSGVAPGDEKGSCNKNLEAQAQVGPTNARKGETPAPVWPLYVAPAHLPDDLDEWFSSDSTEIGVPPEKDQA